MKKTYQTRGLFALSLASVMILAGCLTETDTCNSAAYGGLVGVNIAAVTLPANLEMRIINPGDMVTNDYVAERLNVTVDGQGIIQSLSCG